MAVIEVYSVFGKVVAKPMRLVNIEDVCDANEEEIQNSCESNSDKNKISEVAPEATSSPTEVSSINSETATPTDKQ